MNKTFYINNVQRKQVHKESPRETKMGHATGRIMKITIYKRPTSREILQKLRDKLQVIRLQKLKYLEQMRVIRGRRRPKNKIENLSEK